MQLCHRNLGEVESSTENVEPPISTTFLMHITSALLSPLLLVALTPSCAELQRRRPVDVGVECISLLGIPLEAPALSSEREMRLEAELLVAVERHAELPEDEDAAVWHGRRLAYLGRYREAIEVYSEALELHPRSYRLLRHRGHRYITLRRFDDAVADLEQAAKLAMGIPDSYEQDGAPNAEGLARSTVQSNIYYHLGLALYLRGDYSEARVAWQRCLFYSRVNDDMLVAALYWNVLACWKLNLTAEARQLLSEVQSDMYLLENEDYHRLLLFFKTGEGEPAMRARLDEPKVGTSTLAYGLGAWHLSHASPLQAHQAFQLALGTGAWAAFGFIAAEVELARNQPSKR